MNTIQSIKTELKQQADPEKAAYLPQFFNAVPGGYGEGDRFWGVAVPLQRKSARLEAAGGHHCNPSLYPAAGL
jgi:hypothetical protein